MEPLAETPPPSPGFRYQWSPGYWQWDGHQYVWMSGRWENPPGNPATPPRESLGPYRGY
ncbi:MAG: hypothetical protein LLG01_10045 [Planctomycetaceae bacterium]|nr:hypothetical protein [Planctomycetaceae bacterium]